MSKFTPGPWTLCYDGQIDGPDGLKICGFSWDSYREFNEGNNAANARLIAAAPEMYEMVTEIVRANDCEFREFGANLELSPEIGLKAKAILAKVDGELS